MPMVKDKKLGAVNAAPDFGLDLNCLSEDDKILLQCMRDKVEMDRRKKILNNHQCHYSITYNEKKERWFTRFEDEDGKVIQRSKKTKKELEDLIVAYYTVGIEKEDPKYTFCKAHDRWMDVQVEYGKSNNSIRRYETDWVRFFSKTEFEKKDITKITSKEIEVFMIDNIKKFNLKRRSADGLYSCISGVFYNAVMDRIIKPEDNPCTYVDKKKFVRFYNTDDKTPEERTISEEDLDKLIDRINLDIQRNKSYIYPYGIKLALLTGMRCGEIAGLRWQHVYKDYIKICESEKYDVIERKYVQSKTKTGKIRTIPITSYLRDFLDGMRKLQEEFGIVDDFVLSFKDQKLRGKNLTGYMNHKNDQLHFANHKSIHAIRRTFNSYLRLDGVSATEAGNIIGNTPKVNDMHYTYDIQEISKKNTYVTNAEMRMIRASLC